MKGLVGFAKENPLVFISVFAVVFIGLGLYTAIFSSATSVACNNFNAAQDVCTDAGCGFFNNACTGVNTFQCSDFSFAFSCMSVGPGTSDALKCSWNGTVCSEFNGTSEPNFDNSFNWTDPCISYSTNDTCDTLANNLLGCFWDPNAYNPNNVSQQGACLIMCEPPYASTQASNNTFTINQSRCIDLANESLNLLPPGSPSTCAFNETFDDKCHWSFTGTGFNPTESGGCFQFDGTSVSQCVNNTMGLSCVYNTLFGLCDPASGFSGGFGSDFVGGTGSGGLATCTGNLTTDACFSCGNQTQCENVSADQFGCSWTGSSSTEGVCNPKFFKPGFGGIGGQDCNTDCFACFSNTSCSNSGASCSWTTDPFAPPESPGGFCDPAAMASFKNCDTNPEACMTQAQCLASALAATNGTHWNTTYTIEPKCMLNGSTPEICYDGVDNDGDGFVDCADSEGADISTMNLTNTKCSGTPMCGAGLSGGLPGGGAFLPDPSVCFNADNTNATYCERNITMNDSPALPFHLNNTQVCFYHQEGSESLCDPIFDQQMGIADLGGAPIPIGADATNENKVSDSNHTHLDIAGVGVMETPESLDIGIAIKNMTNFIGCQSYFPGGTNQTGKYYRFLDTDLNTTNGCTAGDEDGNTVTGFEYMILYEAASATNSSLINLSTKVCSDNQLVTNTFATAPVFVKKTCDANIPEAGALGANVVHVFKKDLGNPTADIRVFVSTANSTTNYNNPVDSAGPFYYTPGTIDFEPTNCFIDPSACASQFQPPQGGEGGFFDHEDCSPIAATNTIDSDNDGFSGCDDPDCFTMPWCSSNYNASADTTFPTVNFAKTTPFSTFAIIKWDSNEPVNGSVLFYSNDSTCSELNATYTSFDDPFTSVDNYKPFNVVTISGLQQNTNYHYKLQSIDQANHTSLSSCAGFNTTTSATESTIKFYAPFTPPAGESATDPLGSYGLQIKPPGSNNFQNYGADSAIKTINSSQFLDSDLKLYNPSATSDNRYSLTFNNISLTETKNLNMTGQINITSASNSTQASTSFMLNKTKYEELKQSLAINSMNITIPTMDGIAHNQIYKCDDDGNNCQNVTANLTCTYAAAGTSCYLPTEFSFSTLKTTRTITPSTTPTTPGGTSPSGGTVTASKDVTAPSHTWTTVAAGDEKSKAFSKTGLDVKEVLFTLSKDAGDVKISLKQLSGSGFPSDVPAPGGTLKASLQITLTNVEGLVSSAKIKFDVDKSWLTDNGFEKENVLLQRYHSEKWNKLETKVLSEDNNTVSFEATTPGFSYFAVTAEKPVVEGGPVTVCSEGETRCAENSVESCVNSTWEVQDQCQYGCDSGVCSAAPTESTQQPTQEPVADNTMLLLGAVIAIIIIIALIALVTRRK